MLTFRFSGTDGTMTQREALTSGMVGKQVMLELSPDWDDLSKTVVFSNGSVTLDVLYTGNPVTVPSQVLEEPLKTLTVGVYGVSADGAVVIPTVRAKGPKILPGVDPSGAQGVDAEPAVWAQLQAMIGAPEDLETQERSNLVAAINELAQKMPEAGAPGEDGADGQDARIIAQAEPPEDTAALWVDTGDDSGGDAVYANPLVGKSITFNGDSICAGNGDTLGGYGKIIADRNSMTYQNIAYGGATITAELYSSTTGDPYHWISRTIADMDETADYAIVEGGVNDAWKPAPMGAITSGFTDALDDTTYYGAFESMLKQLIERFPGKKIGYIAVHKTAPDFDSRNESDYYTAALECCKKWGVPVCDLNTAVPPLKYVEALKTAYTVDGDGSHPTVEGYQKFYCDKIEAWLKSL